MRAVMPPLEALIPHREPSCLVTQVVKRLPDGLVCAVCILEGHPLVTKGSAPCYVGLEMAAQTAAVYEALERFARGEVFSPRIGYLVGVRDARFHALEIPAGRRLLACIRSIGSATPLSIYRARVRGGRQTYLEATVSTYIA